MRSSLRLAVGLALFAAACGDAKEGKDGGARAADAGKPAGAPAAAPENDKDALVAAYDKGLDFLMSKQKDGIWSVQGKPHAGFSALAIAPALERPGGVRAKDKEVAAKTLPWLVTQLGDDGGVKAEFTSNYETSVVVMALAASKDPAYKPAIDKAANYLKSLQYDDPANPSYGGIGYGDDGPRSDMSNTQYALAALAAAGVAKDDPVYQKALTFVNRSQNRKENETPGEPTEWTDKESGKKVVRGNDGGSVYFPGNAEHTGYDTAPDGTLVLKSYGSMTYALLRCYHLAGVDANDGRVKAAVDWISKHWTLDANPGMPEANQKDGLFYSYAAIGKTLPELKIDKLKTAEGREVDWRAELSAKLLAEQKADGSWSNPGPRWMESDPVLATSYALTALGACVR